MTHLKYRADIDGLRAVAVLGVIIYHAFPLVLPGGFIGVDIFFVISGYLISGILYKGHKEGAFSFGTFYARRIRRLFPALIILLLICLAYGWLVLTPDEFQQLGEHTSAGIFFIQNITFWKESGYFDTAAALKPLLHLWSLAVEEQFYIFFPLLLLLLWKRNFPLALLLSLLMAGSFAGNIVMSYQGIESDFFLTPYRAWEFLGGALLAWWHFDKGHETEVLLYRNAMSLVGIILLILGMLLIHSSDPYPGWRALLPFTGTLLLIAGSRGAWINKNLLSHPAIVWIGLISYPLYLFHWPAISFVRILKGEKAAPQLILAALGVSFILTLATYYLIERKIRFSKSRYTVPALMMAFLLTGTVGFLIWKGVLPNATGHQFEKAQRAIADRDWGKGMRCLWHQKTMNLDKIGGNGRYTLFYGDSNMQQYEPRIQRLLGSAPGDSRGALFLTCGGVPPITGVTRSDRPESTEMDRKFDDLIKSYPEIDRVVIAALWPYYFEDGSNYFYKGLPLAGDEGREKALHELATKIRSLVAMGKKVTVVLTIPEGVELDPKSCYQRDFIGGVQTRNTPLTSAQYLDRNHHRELLKSLSSIARSSGAEVIDPMDHLCKDGICIQENEDGPIRYNASHLRPGYVREHVNYLDQTVADPLLQKGKTQ